MSSNEVKMMQMRQSENKHTHTSGEEIHHLIKYNSLDEI
jgi:hypothetical protein